jgi:hypothetical protein
MMRKNNLNIYLAVTLLLISIPLPTAKAGLYDYEFNGEVIADGGQYELDLGQIELGKQIKIMVSSSSLKNFDVVLLTDSQHDTWDGTNFIINGSELDTGFAWYTWTTEYAGHFWLIVDNSADITNGAHEGEEITILSGHVNIDDPYGDEFETRLFVEPGTMFHYDLGMVAAGDKLNLRVDCENWITQSVDAFVVSEANRAAFTLSGQEVWDRNASYLDVGTESWSFEVPSAGQWHIYVENGDRGDATNDPEGVLVDVNFDSGDLLPTVIQDTTRMIEKSDTWRVDIGTLSAGDVVSFGLSMDGLFDDLDVLIMTSDEADSYLAGEQATVLGHASLIDNNFFETWDYKFPIAGSYSLILDNTMSPSGGASGDSPIHVEITVQEVTLLGAWLGWYQSRHYVDDGGYVSFDLGDLEVGDDIYYLVSGNSHGSGFLLSYDVLLMDDSQYQSYIAGSAPTLIAEGSDLDTWSSYANYTIATAGHYWVVIDAADGPTDGADSNGAWTFDFTINSDKGGITSPQVEDSNYQMSASHPAGTDIVDGGDSGDGTDGTNNGQEEESVNTVLEDFDYDGLTDDVDTDDDGDGILDTEDLRPKDPDNVDNSVSIRVSESEVHLSLTYISSAIAVMQATSIVDGFSDGNGYVDTETEKDSLEASLCASPAPLSSLTSSTFSFTEWIMNLTLDGSAPSISSDSCTWSDRRDIPTLSLFDSAKLDVEYVIDLEDTTQPFTLTLSNISWNHPSFLPYNSPFSIVCINEVEGTDCSEEEYWYPLSGEISFQVDSSGSSLKDIGDAQSSSNGSMSSSSAALFGICCMVLVATLIIFRRNKGGQQIIHLAPAMAAQPMMGSAQPQQTMMSQPVMQQPVMQQPVMQQPMMQQSAMQPPQQTAQSNYAQSYEQLPAGGNYDYSMGTRYFAPDGRVWIQQPDGSFRC